MFNVVGAILGINSSHLYACGIVKVTRHWTTYMRADVEGGQLCTKSGKCIVEYLINMCTCNRLVLDKYIFTCPTRLDCLFNNNLDPFYIGKNTEERERGTTARPPPSCQTD